MAKPRHSPAETAAIVLMAIGVLLVEAYFGLQHLDRLKVALALLHGVPEQARVVSVQRVERNTFAVSYEFKRQLPDGRSRTIANTVEAFRDMAGELQTGQTVPIVVARDDERLSDLAGNRKTLVDVLFFALVAVPQVGLLVIGGPVLLFKRRKSRKRSQVRVAGKRAN